MDTEIFDRLTRLFERSDTRRAALSTLLGSALLGTALGTASAKPQPNGQGKPNGTGKAKGQGKRRRKRQGRVSAEGNNKKNKPGNHCINPGDVDLNDIYGISVQIVTRFCSEVGSGEKWVTPGAPWFMSGSFESVPEDFEPAGDTPLEDFLAKFEAVKFVIDPDTKHEKTVVFRNDGNLFTGPASLFGDAPSGWEVVSPITLGTLNPLSVGEHAVRLFWRLSDMHCDGIAANVDENCLPGGEEFVYSSVPAFEVVPGHN